MIVKMHSLIESRGIQCEECGKNFASTQTLKEHTKDQHISDKIPCKICHKMLTPRNYNRHMSEVHSNEAKSVKCKLCPRVYARNKALKEHLKNHHQSHNLQVQCEICQKSLFPHNVKRHMNEVHGSRTNEEVKCNVCAKVFASEHSLKAHVRNQHQRVKLQCGICLQSFHPNSLKRHMVEVHTTSATSSKQDNRCVCSICGLSLASHKSLKRHVQAIHGTENRPRVTCELCNHSILAEGFKRHLKDVHQNVLSHDESIPNQDNQQMTEGYKKYLEDEMEQDQNETLATLPNQDFDHIKVHKSRKTEMQCNICGKIFTSAVSLKKHANDQHLSDKIRCELCQRLVVPRRLKYHMQVAHSEPVNCNICSKVFSCEKSLQRHIKNQHQHQRNCCTCNICGLSFSSNKSLERHVEAMHSDKSRPRVTCDLCNHSILAEGFKRHLKKVHPTRSNNAENSCSSSYSKGAEFSEDKHEMEQDQNEAHPNQDIDHIPECAVCNQTFSKPEDFENHIKEHHSGSRGKITFSL